MTLNALRSNSLVDQATERLREEIAAGTWPVGTKLPGETTLAAQLGVGRSTVREAVRALTGAGLVQARQGAGVFVISATPYEDWPTRLRTAAITQIYEVRAMLEVEAAQLAARRRTPEDMLAIDAAMQRRRDAASGSNAEFIDADIQLHTAIVAAAHNPLVTGLFEEFAPSLRQGLIDLLELVKLRDTAPNHGEDVHAALVEAVRRGDPEAAGSLLRGEFEQTLTLMQTA